MAAEHIAEFNAKQKKEGAKLTGVMATFIERLAADLVVAYHSGLGLRYAGKVNGIYPQECLSVLQGLSGGKIIQDRVNRRVQLRAQHAIAQGKND